MSNKKLREKKKQQRKEIARKRVLTRRAELRKTEKELRTKAAAIRHFELEKPLPIRNHRDLPAMTDQKQVDDARKDARIKHQLEKNMKILEALEKEFDAEADVREFVNKSLEDQNATTFQDKINLLGKMREDFVPEKPDNNPSETK